MQNEENVISHWKLKSQSYLLTDVVIVFLSFSDEQEAVQKRTFTKWINSHLAKVRCFSSECHNI